MSHHLEHSDDLPAMRNRLERINCFYAMLCQINRQIVRAVTPQDLYDAVCRIAVDSGAFTLAAVSLLIPSAQQIVTVASAGKATETDAVPFDTTADDDPHPIAAAASSGKASLDADLALGHSAWRRRYAEAGLRSLAAQPLRINGVIVGILTLGADIPAYFQQAESRLLGEIADDISFALGAMRREEQRSAAETRVQFLAYYDAVSGLPGRALFIQRAEAIRASAEHLGVVILAARLRRYHGVLHALGQEQGALLARAIGHRLERLFPAALIGRVSESEFAIIPEGLREPHQIEETAWQVHAALAAAVPAVGKEVFLDPFLGIARTPQDGAPADALNAALIAAASGPDDAGSCCRFYVADMDRGSHCRLDLEAALRHAIEKNEFVLHYQPQANLVSGAICGAEALIRWQRPGFGLIPPRDFIPMLEETGLIVQAGEWVIREACRQARLFQDSGLPPIRIAVNLSARQFQASDIEALVVSALADTRLDACWLELELTESAMLVDADTVIRTLNTLRTRGIHVALDDFGTGYASLSYLQRIPATRVKIDQSFIADVTSNPHNAAIVRAVVGMAHHLGMSIIAEGVETEGQLGFLCGLQCEEMQGFYFSPPLPANEFAALLRDQRHLLLPKHEERQQRILLVVDDEPAILSALRRLLRRTEMQVLTTSSVREAFELLVTHPVGVVLSDQRMPEMTGTEFLRRVKELHPEAIRMILSGYTELNSVADAVNRGAVFRFLTKPWDEDALLAALRNAFHTYEMERENRALSKRLAVLENRAQHTAQDTGAT